MYISTDTEKIDTTVISTLDISLAKIPGLETQTRVKPHTVILNTLNKQDAN